MRNVELVKFLGDLDNSILRDLGIGLGLMRVEMGIHFGAVGDHMLPRSGDWTGVQALALIELGMADWMRGNLDMVAKVVEGLAEDFNEHKVRKASVKAFAQACIRAPRAADHGDLMRRMQMAAAAALNHGVDVWWDWSDDNGDVYSIANFDVTERNEALPTDKVYYLHEPAYHTDEQA